MKDLPRRLPLAEETAHQEDITPEFEAGTEPRAFRRTTVTIERETLSVLTRRAIPEAVGGRVVTPAAHPSEGEIAPEAPDPTPAQIQPRIEPK
jgi:hypothetical protein